ncbi:uncharacterized protein LOC62_03G003895 [Vanrija pseudolonga]|uniref:Uncharacterized protein n=1 Tax=Vanrija pseudolonga TaxID=143232 RepID=A0AAF0Y9C6_9TREE|nr:hypothetical protein LOC62_03G003895 [Vanrija pseudolonga]
MSQRASFGWRQDYKYLGVVQVPASRRAVMTAPLEPGLHTVVRFLPPLASLPSTIIDAAPGTRTLVVVHEAATAPALERLVVPSSVTRVVLYFCSPPYEVGADARRAWAVAFFRDLLVHLWHTRASMQIAVVGLVNPQAKGAEDAFHYAIVRAVQTHFDEASYLRHVGAPARRDTSLLEVHDLVRLVEVITPGEYRRRLGDRLVTAVTAPSVPLRDR